MVEYIEAVRKIMTTKSAWVLFSHGTFVVVDKPQEGSSLEEQALEAMEEYGEVMVACSAGDFNVIDTEKGCYAVTGHCPYMYTCVLADEVEPGSPDVMVGMYGRGKRNEDFEDHTIVHVESARQ